jgi:adenylylsulfate kinase-like enzyme
LERRLRDEGYSTSQLDGPALRRQIRTLLAASAEPQVQPSPNSTN